MKVKINPIKKRAKERVRQHGAVMVLIAVSPSNERFLVESIDNTWQNEKWKGWFSFEEATYSTIH